LAKHLKVGNYGERKAAEYLISLGYDVLERNYRFGRAEIDIIAKFKQTMVFVEVKTRKNTNYGYPEDFVDEKKIERIQNAAEKYCLDNHWQSDIRFDIIAIVTNSRSFELEHFEDAF